MIDVKIKPVVVSVLLIAIAICVQSESAGAFLLLGPVSCKTWLADRAKQINSKDLANEIGEIADVRWLLGYLSGLNLSPITKNDVLAGVDLSMVEDWTDAYCKKNPDKGAYDGASELFMRLSK